MGNNAAEHVAITQRTHALIKARLDFFPKGCYVQWGRQTTLHACPFLTECSALPPSAEVLCEVTDVEAEIDLTKTNEYPGQGSRVNSRKAVA